MAININTQIAEARAEVVSQLAAFSNINPVDNHQPVHQKIIDLIGLLASLSNSSGGGAALIQVKDDNIIIPSSGHWINSLDFTGATGSYVVKITEPVNQNVEFVNGVYKRSDGGTIDIGVVETNLLLSKDSGIGISSVSMTSFGSVIYFDIVFDSGYISGVDYSIDFAFLTTANRNDNNLSVGGYTLLNKTSAGVTIGVRETVSLAQTFFGISLNVTRFNGFKQEFLSILSNENLSIGGTFPLQSNPSNHILNRLYLVISGGTTPGSYILF